MLERNTLAYSHGSKRIKVGIRALAWNRNNNKNIRLGWTNMIESNTLAYWQQKESFMEFASYTANET